MIEHYPKGIGIQVSTKNPEDKQKIYLWIDETYTKTDVGLLTNRAYYKEKLRCGLMCLGYTEAEAREVLDRYEMNTLVIGMAVCKEHDKDIVVKFAIDAEDIVPKKEAYFG